MNCLGLSRIRKEQCISIALICCVLTALFLPFSTALTNIFSIAAIALWLIGADLKSEMQRLLKTPFACALMLFLLFVCLSAFWNEGTWSSYWSEFRNYRRFFFLLVLFLLGQNRESWREGMLFAFFISTAILTIVCVGIYFGVPFLPSMRPGQGAIFHKTHIAQGFLLGCHMVIAIRYVIFSKHIELQIAAACTALLAFVVSVFMTYGRTGYLCVAVCLVMATVFFLLEKRKKNATFFAVILVSALIAGALSNHVQTRWNNVLSDIAQFQQGNEDTSMGLRFYYWKTSLKVIEDNPVIGVGCGALEPTSCRYAVGSPNKDGTCLPFSNPHEDYLFVLAQYGIVGFILWIAFFIAFVRESLTFSLKDKWTLWGITALYLAGSFFNTFSRDITECTTFVLLIATLLATQDHRQDAFPEEKNEPFQKKNIKLPVSVVLITHNEEKNIASCLSSCCFAKEIVVVDDDSSDRTVEIARTFEGTRIFHRALDGDFGAQKNFGVSQVTNDWIFLIDADERVTTQLAEFMQSVVRSGEKCCYWIQRENRFKNMTVRHGTMRPDWVPRLMPRDGVNVVGCVHEAVVSPWPKREASGRLLHYSYVSWDQYYSKQMLYSCLAAKKLQEQNRPCDFFSHVVFHPIWAFIKVYFFNLGFLDGKAGFIFAANHYAYTLSKYVRYYQIRHFEGVL